MYVGGIVYYTGGLARIYPFLTSCVLYKPAQIQENRLISVREILATGSRNVVYTTEFFGST